MESEKYKELIWVYYGETVDELNANMAKAMQEYPDGTITGDVNLEITPYVDDLKRNRLYFACVVVIKFPKDKVQTFYPRLN